MTLASSARHTPAQPERSRRPGLAALAALASIDAEHWRSGELARRRVQALLGLLARRSYARAWAPDCADDELAAQLARVATHLWVTPSSAEVAARIALRCAHLRNVTIDLSEAISAAKSEFDLVVVSRFDTFNRSADLIQAADALARSLAPCGELVAVHALGYAEALGSAARRTQALHGDAVHHLLLEHLPLRWRAGDRDGEFRLDAWVR